MRREAAGRRRKFTRRDMRMSKIDRREDLYGQPSDIVSRRPRRLAEGTVPAALRVGQFESVAGDNGEAEAARVDYRHHCNSRHLGTECGAGGLWL